MGAFSFDLITKWCFVHDMVPTSFYKTHLKAMLVHFPLDSSRKVLIFASFLYPEKKGDYRVCKVETSV